MTRQETEASMNVLVTGGAGFIGSHACRALHAVGYRPVVYDDLSTGHADAVRWGPLEVGDVRDGERLQGVLRRHAPAAIMHFAASAYVGESVLDPKKYYSNNVRGMQVLLESAVAASIRTIILSSSCATYGVPEQLPINETSPQKPINPYGRTKLVCEMMLEDFSRAYDVRYGILRYFNACGADPNGELQERHDPETHLIPRVLMAACGVIETVDVFGTDYPTPDGTCVRDYIHVTDLAAGHLSALSHLLSGGRNLTLNLGVGRGYSVREIIDTAEKIVGKRVPVTLSPRRPGDPPELVADPGSARAQLGFMANNSDLESILKSALQSVEIAYCGRETRS
jgi:UDP-arabinose 4-epimerase